MLRSRPASIPPLFFLFFFPLVSMYRYLSFEPTRQFWNKWTYKWKLDYFYVVLLYLFRAISLLFRVGLFGFLYRVRFREDSTRGRNENIENEIDNHIKEMSMKILNKPSLTVTAWWPVKGMIRCSSLKLMKKQGALVDGRGSILARNNARQILIHHEILFHSIDRHSSFSPFKVVF